MFRLWRNGLIAPVLSETSIFNEGLPYIFLGDFKVKN